MKIKGEDILFAILIALTCLGLLTSCTVDQYNDHELLEQYLDDYYSQRPTKKFEPKAFIISESKYQNIYLDTTDEYTYFQIYAEATEMPESQRYNGENNIWASFSTPNHWIYSDSNISNEPVYYVASTAVRFDYPKKFNGRITGYQPKQLDLYTKQNVGPIPVNAIKQRDTVPIYMDVSFDGKHHVKDTLFIVLQPR